jgi:hypothetical protein
VIDLNFQIILRSGESIELSCGPGQGQSFNVPLAPKQAVILKCGDTSIQVQCQPGNVQQTLGPIFVDKNQTVVVSCQR